MPNVTALPPSPASFIARLRATGLRSTRGRRAMVAALLRSPTPLTLAQLQAAVRPQPVPLATLFRSMLRMEKFGLVRRTYDPRGTALWELLTGRPRSFPLNLRDAHETSVLDDELSAPLREVLALVEARLADRGYRDVRLNVAFRAVRPALRQLSVA
jgi:Fe2+ or Zn2+ uptake regulation protein